ncbi:MAG: BspA family leucine-rich repeat surface protein, partial [Clostridia bacterium]|nr:BspA family leucine-rich repeat surface protein [Clostridia bacterium]
TTANSVESAKLYKEYDIEYDLDGGTVSSANPTTYTQASSAITLNNPTKEGYTFSGWTVGKNLLDYNNLGQRAVNNYGIVVDSNGNISDSSPTSDSRDWNKFSNNNWTISLEPGTYTLSMEFSTYCNSGTSGYAILKEDSSFIKSRINGELNNKDLETYTFTLDEASNIGIMIKAYQGVYKVQLDKGSEYTGFEPYIATPNNVVTIPTGSGGNRTYKANWTPYTYTIAYNANGGTGTMADTTGVQYDSGVTLRTNTFTRSGYTFMGWSTNSAAKKADIADGQSVVNLTSTNGATITLYAVWYDFILQQGPALMNNISSSVRKVVFTDQSSPSGVTLTDVSANQNGSVMAWTSGTTMYISTRTSGRKVIANAVSDAMFASKSNLTEIDLSNLDTSNATSMNSMFGGCSGLTSLDLSGFNTANVTNMGSMFGSCSGLTELDLTKFNTASVTNMASMFVQCTNLETIYVSNSFSVSGVTSSNGMFGNCTQLVGGAGTTYDSTHTDKAYAKVDGGKANPGYFTGDDRLLKGTDFLSTVGNATTTVKKLVFTDITAPSGAILTDVSELHNNSIVCWTSGDTRYISTQVTGKRVYTNSDCSEMFESRDYELYDFSNLDTTYAINMNKMFYGTRVDSLDLSGFNTTNVTDMSEMFHACTKLTSLNLSGWDTSSVTDSSYMFYNSNKITSLDLTDFDTSSVTNMDGMFAQCNLLVTIYVESGFVVGSSTNGFNMFYDAKNIVGGAGTTYSSTNTGVDYAHVDGGSSNPGYFSSKYGKYVDYGIDLNNDGDTTNDWRLLFDDGDNAYLIAADYLEDESFLPETSNGNIMQLEGSNDFSFYDVIDDYTGASDIVNNPDLSSSLSKYHTWINTHRTSTYESTRAIAYLLDTEIWTDMYGNSYSDYVIGSPTIEMIASSYNDMVKSIDSDSSVIEYNTEHTYGYYIRLSNGTWRYSLGGLNRSLGDLFFKTKEDATALWLASPSEEDGNEDYVMVLRYSGVIGAWQYGDANGGLRPVVCLKSSVKLQDSDGDGVFSLSGN